MKTLENKWQFFQLKPDCIHNSIEINRYVLIYMGSVIKKKK